MKTIFEIRRANLILLIAQAGSTTALADRSDASASYISQVKHGTRSKDGSQRNLGPKLARRLEAAMNKPTGWMDKEHPLGGEAEIRDTGAAYSQELYHRLAKRIAEAVRAEAQAARADGMSITDKRLLHETLPLILALYAQKIM